MQEKTEGGREDRRRWNNHNNNNMRRNVSKNTLYFLMQQMDHGKLSPDFSINATDT